MPKQPIDYDVPIEKPKLEITYPSGEVVEVEPIKLWQPCVPNEDGICGICNAKGDHYGTKTT